VYDARTEIPTGPDEAGVIIRVPDPTNPNATATSIYNALKSIGITAKYSALTPTTQAYIVDVYVAPLVPL